MFSIQAIALVGLSIRLLSRMKSLVIFTGKLLEEAAVYGLHLTSMLCIIFYLFSLICGSFFCCCRCRCRCRSYKSLHLIILSRRIFCFCFVPVVVVTLVVATVTIRFIYRCSVAAGDSLCVVVVVVVIVAFGCSYCSF